RGLEDVLARPEGDSRPVRVRRTDLGEVLVRDAVREGLRVQLAARLHVDGELAGQRVHHGDTDAVQTAGHLVPAAAELAAGVQHGEYDGDGRLALGLDDADRDAAAVVLDADAAVGQQGHQDAVAVPGHRLVDRVV